MNDLRIQTADGAEFQVGDRLVLQEKQSYALLLDNDAQLFVGHRELPRVGDHRWALPIEFWAGQAKLRVVRGAAIDEVAIEVVPDPQKLSESAWETVVAELERFLSGATLGTAGGAHGTVNRTGVSLHLLTEAVLPLLPRLLASLAGIVRDPRVQTEEWQTRAPLHQTRRVERETVVWLARHSTAASHLRPELLEVQGAPPLVPIHRGFETPDHPVNRYVAWLCWQVERRLLSCADAWCRFATAQDDVAAWAAGRADACQRAARSLSMAANRSFLRQLQRQPATDAALLVAVNDPSYARFVRTAQRFLSPLFDPSQTSDTAAPTRETYGIYELWCFVEVQRVLRAALPTAQWESRHLERLLLGTGAGASLTAHQTGGRTICIEFNPTFTSYWTRGRGAAGRRWSLSAERRPDIVVSASGGGRAPAWLVLDAKYRVNQSALADAFASIHIYRDSLRYEVCGGKCTHAALLAPARLAQCAEWFDESFFSEHACGVFELRPAASGSARMGEWILGVLG